jgi:hypothetical protein
VSKNNNQKFLDKILEEVSKAKNRTLESM